jgi:succinate-semialdehyde dehydrogenase / glutarate-semialdehyde dehydrogenase
MKNQLQNSALWREAALIDGDWIGADDGARLAVYNPATRDIIAHVPAMGTTETKRAVSAAQRMFGEWKARPAAERARLLRRWYRLMTDHADDLAQILTAEQGKPLAEAKGEITYAAAFLDWFADEARRIYGDVIPAASAAMRVMTIKQPVGVVAAITPWNFPAAMITRKVGAALAAGCTVVVKPSELTPLTALALASLAEAAGIPAGVINVVTGLPQPIGQALTSDYRVRKLTFTGSTAVGKLLAAQCAPTLKRLSLELGGNAAFIVFDDADLEAAVNGAIASKFRNAGQTCVCANRLFVQEGIHDRFVSSLAERVAAMRTGPGQEPGVLLGPLINDSAIAKVERHVADALAKGGTVAVGGTRLTNLGPGAYYAPTVLIDAHCSMALAQEETFGPVAPIFRFREEQEVLDYANGVETGLAAYVFTSSINRSIRIAEALESGMVGINTGVFSNEAIPFGGIKDSGYGREGSKYGIDEYLDIKSVILGVSAQ